MPPRVPDKSVPMPPPQRSKAEPIVGSPTGGEAGFAVGGLAGVDPPVLTGGLGRFVMSDGSESAFAPALRLTPANEAGCAFELECVAAPLQAAVSSAAATRSTRSALIAIGTTHRTTAADGLDAA